MKLSDAIRLGSMLRPQGFGAVPCRENQLTFCTLEAAIAAGYRYEKPGHVVACPACQGNNSRGIESIVVHLNDHHHWTRERIADWVETIEPADDPLPPPQPLPMPKPFERVEA